MKIIYLVVVLIFFNSCGDPSTSVNQQKTAIDRLGLAEKGIELAKLELFLQAFKQEQVLQVWAKSKQDEIFQHLVDYDFCKFSGKLGPKRKEGDFQVPEGCYFIDRFNPQSKFHLSLGLNYPNNSDKIRGNPTMPGSDIFIHGGCMTVGCIPITDEKIETLYALADKAYQNGQTQIPVYIFPAKLTNANFARLSEDYPQHRTFWAELKPIYQYVEEHKKLPRVGIDDSGAYYLN